MAHSPHGVGTVAGAVFVTDEAIETRGTEPLLAIRAFKASFTETGSIDMMTLGSILTLTLLVALQTEAAHRTVILTPGGHRALKFVERNITYFCGNLQLSCNMELKTMKVKTLCQFIVSRVNQRHHRQSLNLELRWNFSPWTTEVTIDFSPHWNIQI